jgi:hypothetical protein
MFQIRTACFLLLWERVRGEGAKHEPAEQAIA